MEARPFMAFWVLMNRKTRQDRLDEVLARIRQRLAESSTQQRSRRASRVFQRLGDPTHLLTVSEWVDERSFTEFSQSAIFAETDAIGGSRPEIVPLVPLLRYEHMARRAAICSCVTITATPDAIPELREYLVRQAHQEIKSLSGVVSREVFAARDTAGTYLVIHGWQALADLERFRSTEAPALDSIHERLQTELVVFTGALTAEFSAFEPPA
jgi:heme-degrading monooxygenase HmoA